MPASAAPGSYILTLIVADEVNPDDNYSTSPDVTFSVRAPEVTPPPPPPPSWLIPAIIAGVVIILLIIVGGILISRNQTPPPTPTPTLVPPPTATVVVGPCSITLTAAQYSYSEPDTVPSNLFDQVAPGTDIKPIGQSADGTWWEVTEFGQNVWMQRSLLNSTATITGDCSTLPVVCLLAISGRCRSVPAAAALLHRHAGARGLAAYSYRQAGG